MAESDKEIIVSKQVLPELPPEYTVTMLGELRGAIRQYRGPGGIHVREYDDEFVIHVDSVDPRINPIGHLVRDSPETIFALGASTLLSRQRSSDTDPSVRSSEGGKAESLSGFGLGSFLISLLFFEKIFRDIKFLLRLLKT